MNDFASMFEKAAGQLPFPWQCALYECFITGKIPDSVSIPTGLGKTSVITIWMIALATHPYKVPRRLVYVVNRRTVVDQTTAEAQKLVEALKDPGLADLNQSLRNLCALPCESPLAISTLRGQFADNGEWRRDPARPAVIIGTVDMIGSGLLFSRYTSGFKTRPLYAGFLGQDALIVHDEAHLEPAFQTLIEEIHAEQNGLDDPAKVQRDLKPIRIMALTATTRSETTPFSLTDDDRTNRTVIKRLKAVKRLSLIAVDDEKHLKDLIPEKAKTLDGSILVFVRSVDNALKIATALDKGEHKGQVIKLTGTMRGKERDELVNDMRFQRFLDPESPPDVSPVFLVCTSAGEVGVNISADHCVCDLSTYESMAQRFGRVNRFGKRKDSTITVFHEKKFDIENKKLGAMEKARAATLALLKQLPKADATDQEDVYNASPDALEKLPADERAAAFSPSPTIRVATQIQFDAWALTSIREPIAARPPVAPYLHGEAEWQPPETHVAWRDDRDFDARIDPNDFIEWFPLKPRELLRDRTTRIVGTLEKLIKGKDNLPNAWLIDDCGSVLIFPLSKFDKERALNELANATLILPTSLGGLQDGLFTGDGATLDVSEIDRRETDTRDATADFSLNLTDENDDEPKYRHWFAPSDPQDKLPLNDVKDAVSLPDHAVDVTANVRAIAAKLGLPSDIQAAIVDAAQHHDDGKARAQWQRSIGNRSYPKTVLAKSSGCAPAVAETYRHEFGSLFRQASGSPATDLADHIIVAHHGRARPHFPVKEIFDPERSPSESLEVANAVPQRFATLQNTYGRWGLAYLESILRAADYAASAGIVVNDTLLTQTAPTSPIVLAARSSCGSNVMSVALNPLNPGHYFACCGLFELASRLYPEATAHFDGNRFLIHAPTTLADLFNQICASTIKSAEDGTDDEASDDSDDTESDSSSDKEVSAPPLFFGAPFNVRLDWWVTLEKTNASALKVWAGSMKVLRIANSMLFTLGYAIKKNASFDYANILFDSRVALDSLKNEKGKKKVDEKYANDIKIAQEERDASLQKIRNEKTGEELERATQKIEAVHAAACVKADKRKTRSFEQLEKQLLRSKTEPFYFDAKRGPNADSRDVGFSPNDLKLKTLAAPAVELLCLIGLQRAIPRPVGTRQFEYSLWEAPISISLLAAAVNGMIQTEPQPAYRFESWFRTSQRKHKAFLTAKPIQPQTKRNP